MIESSMICLKWQQKIIYVLIYFSWFNQTYPQPFDVLIKLNSNWQNTYLSCLMMGFAALARWRIKWNVPINPLKHVVHVHTVF